MLHWTRRVLRWLALIAAAGIGVLLFLYLAIFVASLFMPPLQPVAVTSTPNPAATYDEAVARFDQLVANYKAQDDLQEVCYPQLLTHGEKTAVALVLLHGLTACPYQYHELAQE